MTTASGVLHGTSLSAEVAERIRAELGQQNLSKSELARRLRKGEMWVSYRLRNKQEIGLDDLVLIAGALGKPWDYFLPPSSDRVSQTTALLSSLPEQSSPAMPLRARRDRSDRPPGRADRTAGSTRPLAPARPRPGKHNRPLAA